MDIKTERRLFAHLAAISKGLEKLAAESAKLAAEIKKTQEHCGYITEKYVEPRTVYLAGAIEEEDGWV